MTRSRVWFLAVLVPAVLAVGLISVRAFGDHNDLPSVVATDDDEFEHDYVIEPGTAERIAAGEEIEVVPRELKVRVGESIRIVNQDDANHSVGAFYVAAGQTLRQHFQAPAELTGECSVHPSGQFTLIIEE